MGDAVNSVMDVGDGIVTGIVNGVWRRSLRVYIRTNFDAVYIQRTRYNKCLKHEHNFCVS